jgi:hypothetical protein
VLFGYYSNEFSHLISDFIVKEDRNEMERGRYRIFATEDQRLVESKPVLYFIPIAAEHNSGIIDIVVYDIRAEPTAVGILEKEWQVPMVEGYNGLNIVLEASVYQIVVML